MRPVTNRLLTIKESNRKRPSRSNRLVTGCNRLVIHPTFSTFSTIERPVTNRLQPVTYRFSSVTVTNRLQPVTNRLLTVWARPQHYQTAGVLAATTLPNRPTTLPNRRRIGSHNITKPSHNITNPQAYGQPQHYQTVSQHYQPAGVLGGRVNFARVRSQHSTRILFARMGSGEGVPPNPPSPIPIRANREVAPPKTYGNA